MIPLIAKPFRPIQLVVLTWLIFFWAHCTLLASPWWNQGEIVLFVNIALLMVGAILHVRPGSLKDWGRPDKWLLSIFSWSYMFQLIVTLLSLYDLQYVGMY